MRPCLIRISVPLILVAIGGACKTTSQNSSLQTASRPGDTEEALTDPSKNPTHFAGPFTLAGKYALNPESITARYKNLDYQVYGSMKLLGPDGQTPVVTASGKTKYVRDVQYYLGDGKVGIRPFPAVEPANVPTPGPLVPFVDESVDTAPAEAAMATATVANASVKDGALVKEGTSEVKGLNDLDDYIMTHLPNDRLSSIFEIFTLTAYTHPEEFQGAALALPPMKLQGAYSHMGSYFGRDVSRNAPFDFEQHKLWGHYGSQFPIDIVEVRFKEGTSRKVTNVNTRIVNTILNGNGDPKYTVIFPSGGYKFDWLMLDSVANNLHFFAAWVDPEYAATFKYSDNGAPEKDVKWVDAVKNVAQLQTYCAEHVSASLNIGFNLPFNEQAFVTAYGDVDGKRIFARAKERYKLLTGSEAKEQDFEPLYRKNGMSGAPLSMTESNAGLVWPMQSTVDFVANLLEQYVAWPDVGAAVSALTLVGLQKEVNSRTGMSTEEYLGLYAVPVIVQAYVFEAMTKIGASGGMTFDDYRANAVQGTTALFNQAGAQAAAPLILAQVQKALDSQKGMLEAQAKPIPPEAGWELFRKAIQPQIEAGRKRDLKCDIGKKCVKWYSPPSITHRISVGIHESNPAIVVETLGTIFDPVDLVKVSDDASSTLSIDMQSKKVLGLQAGPGGQGH